MSDTGQPPFSRHSLAIPASLAALVLALASCSTASPAASSGPSSAAAAACSLTPNATSSATIEINSNSVFGAAVTVSAGQAVTFDNKDSTAHTITQGTNGTAVSGACVDEPISAGAKVVVTFTKAGDYDITCTIHRAMHTQVHVT